MNKKREQRDFSKVFLTSDSRASAIAIDSIIGNKGAGKKLSSDMKKLRAENAKLRQEILELNKKLALKQEIMDLRLKLRPVEKEISA